MPPSTSTYPFLQPSLSYDANNVYLTLQPGGFAAAAQTPTSTPSAACSTPTSATASGDFATVLNAHGDLNTQPGPGRRMTAHQRPELFRLLQHHGAGRPALHEQLRQPDRRRRHRPSAIAWRWPRPARSPAMPPAAPLWGAWGGALGGLGTIGANAGTGGVTYNVGGFAAGLDRADHAGRPRRRHDGLHHRHAVVVGLQRQRHTDTFLAGLYGSYRRTRSTPTPCWATPTATTRCGGRSPSPACSRAPRRAAPAPTSSTARSRAAIASTSARAADAYITPFARLQGYTGTQNGFTETGAQSLNLTVAGTDHQLAALGDRRAARRRDRSRLAREAGAAVPAGLEPRVCQHGAAGDGDAGRRAADAVHHLRHRPAA